MTACGHDIIQVLCQTGRKDSEDIHAMKIKNSVDIIEKDILDFDKAVLEILLKDRTTQKNILWATDDYEVFGELYRAECQITMNLITADGSHVIQPRTTKSQQNQSDRRKRKAEVFTPSWICNAQNNLIDNAWFGYKGAFNQEGYQSWTANPNKVTFAAEGSKTWNKYVDSPRMEITCGEAPYLVSRYDAVNGTEIPVSKRIGLLDRKLRAVNENTESEEEWYQWTVRAFQSIYGFEFQGDNLLLARENLLYTFIDNLDYKFHREPELRELRKIAHIISWNIWQMDGLTFTVPYTGKKSAGSNENLGDNGFGQGKYCVIKDWRAARWKKKSVLEYRSLLKAEV